MFHTKKGFYTTGFYWYRTWIVWLCKLAKSTQFYVYWRRCLISWLLRFNFIHNTKIKGAAILLAIFG